MKKEEIIKGTDLKILKPYENKWVALSGNRKKVVANGNTLSQVILQAKKKSRDLKKLSFVKVLPFGVSYAPNCL